MDVQSYTVEEFLSFKNITYDSVPIFKSKLDALLQLACFNVRETLTQLKPQYVRKHHHAPRKCHNKTRDDKPAAVRKPMFSIEPINKVQGLLNKMCHAKYQTLATQVSDLVCQVPFEAFMACLIDQSCKHSFTKEFVYTLHHVYNNHEDLQPHIIAYLKTYISDLQHDDVIKWCGDVGTESYDEFCDRVKAKNTSIGKIRTLCELYYMFDVKDDISEFITWYIDYGTRLFSEQLNVTDTELYLESLVVLIDKMPHIKNTVITQTIVEQWKASSQEVLPKRTVFKLMDLAEALEKI